jgi:hypothetical protein
MVRDDGGRRGTGAEVLDENERDGQHGFGDEEMLEVHNDSGGEVGPT